VTNWRSRAKKSLGLRSRIGDCSWQQETLPAGPQPTDYAETYCIYQLKALNEELQKKLQKKDKELADVWAKAEEYKLYSEELKAAAGEATKRMALQPKNS